ncbi:MAG: hypothetical protein H8E98_07830 [Bacteroidetes bacterium]|nr:hypothetical protein [Bacteroidota bacterium]
MGILVILITAYHFLDPIIAILVALLILKESFNLLKKSYKPLLDYKLPNDEIDEIKRCIYNHCNDYIQYHNFRNRKAGHLKYIDFHLEVPANLTVEESHDLCDKIEKNIESKIKNIDLRFILSHLKKINQKIKFLQ